MNNLLKGKKVSGRIQFGLHGSLWLSSLVVEEDRDFTDVKKRMIAENIAYEYKDHLTGLYKACCDSSKLKIPNECMSRGYSRVF